MKKVLLGLLLLCSGCASLSGMTPESQIFSAPPMAPSSAFGSFDLVAYLDPDAKRSNPVMGGHTDAEMAKALLAFSQAPDQERRRNNTQDLLLAASDVQCAAYLTGFKRLNTDTNVAFQMLSVLSGAAGALVSGGLSPILSAVAGGAAGVQATLDSKILGNLAFEVIAKGIQAARGSAKAAIQARRSSKPSIDDYSVMAAIGDALGLPCDLETGLRTASSALDKKGP